MSQLLTLFNRKNITSLNLPSTPLAIYSVVKTPTWTGACIRIKRSSDSTQTDIGFTTSGYMDVEAAIAFAAGSIITVEKWYDQSGNGYDAIAVVGKEPRLIIGNAVNGVHSITFMDVNGSGNGGFTIPAGVVADGRNFTFAQAISVGGGWSPATGNALGGLGTTVSLKMSIARGVYENSAGGFAGGDRKLFACRHGQVDSVIYSGDASGLYLRVNGNAASTTALAAGATAGGYIGMTAATANTAIEMFGCVVYGTALSAGDKTSVDNAFKSAFKAIPTVTSKIVYDGDSITAGIVSETGVYLMGYPRAVSGINGQATEINNIGVPSQTMVTCYANRVNATGRYNSVYAKNVNHIFAGTNDLALRATGTIVGYGTTLWTTALLPYIQAMQAAGFSRVIVGTMIARNWTGSAQDKIDREAERLVYNQLIRDNATTYGYTVVDYAGLAAFSTYSDTTYFVADGIHLNRVGNATLGAFLAPIIGAWS